MLEIYGHPLSQPTRAVMQLLRAADIDCTFRYVDLLKGAQREKSFLQLNPVGKVPVLVEDDFVLSEGAAILIYLCKTRELGSWYPLHDIRQQARIDQWLNWSHLNSRLGSIAVYAPAIVGIPAREGDMQAFEKALALLEDRLSEVNFVAGSEGRSVADLFILVELDQLQILDLYDFSKFPNLIAWIERMSKTVEHYDEIIKPLQRLAEKRKTQKAAL